MKTISATEFFRKTNHYLDMINKGEIVIIRRKNGEMYTLVPVPSDFKEDK